MREDWKFGVLENGFVKASSNLSINKLNNDNGDFPFYGAKGLIKNISFYHQEKEYIAIIKDGAGVGRVSIHPPKSSVVGTLQYLLPKEGFNLRFLYYYLLSIDFSKHFNGSTIPHIYFKDYKSEPFPLVSKMEQKEIASILDDAFASIDKAKANIERNIENAKELFQSKLNQIFSQTGEIWEEKKLKEITNKIGSGATPRGGQSSYKEFGISLIRSMNVHDDGFRHKKLAFIDDEQASKLDNVTIQKNDVLLNITGASVARCCIVDSNYLPARVNQHVSIIRLKEGVMSCQFLHYALTSKVTKNLLLGIGEQGATRQAITKVQIENFSVKFPKSIDLQNKLVSSIDIVKIKSEKLESSYQEKLESLEDLRKSILQKVFRGELTNKSVAS